MAFEKMHHARRLLAAAIAGALPAAPVVATAQWELAFSTYMGGSSWEQARDVIADAQGNIYVVGGGNSANFPTTPGVVQPTKNTTTSGSGLGSFGQSDVYVVKFGPTGNVIWSTFLGGPGYDRAYAVELDPQGNVVIAGRAGQGFPVTANAFQKTFAGTPAPSSYGDQNAFAAKLSNDGGTLLWASYVGVGELARNVAVDKNGDVYVPLVRNASSSNTMPPAFANAFDNAYRAAPVGTTESGIAKLKADGTAIEWATWIGGSGTDEMPATVRVDDDNQPTIVFRTASTDAPVVGAGAQAYHGGTGDMYVAAFTADGSALRYATYVGGNGQDGMETHSLALDSAGKAIVALTTQSTNAGMTTIPSSSFGGSDIAIFKLGLDGGVEVSNRWGTSTNDAVDGVYVDAQGRVFISGETNGPGFPVTPGQFNHGGGRDPVLMVLSSDLTTVEFSTYFGGSNPDLLRAIAIGDDGSFWSVGGTLSTNFPTLNAYDSTFNGGNTTAAPASGDLVIVRYSPIPEPASLSVLALAALALRRRR